MNSLKKPFLRKHEIIILIIVTLVGGALIASRIQRQKSPILVFEDWGVGIENPNEAISYNYDFGLTSVGLTAPSLGGTSTCGGSLQTTYYRIDENAYNSIDETAGLEPIEVGILNDSDEILRNDGYVFLRSQVPNDILEATCGIETAELVKTLDTDLIKL